MWIKVCGIRDVETAVKVAEAGADAIGLNFYPESVRCVSRQTAQSIVRALPASVARVGVFVNAPVSEVVDIARETGLTAVQLHGDETAKIVAETRQMLPELQLIRAWRVGSEGLTPLVEHCVDCRQLGGVWDACLVDARVGGSYGGTGATAPWELLASEWSLHALPRLILAGGLTVENVSQAVSEVHPWGVDVASGVESSPGVKNLELVRKFIERARASEGTACRP
jgi:phosphoribosylanthranilate isomerase